MLVKPLLLRSRLLFMASMALLSNTAALGQENALSGILSAGPIQVPDFQGSEDYKVVPYVYTHVQWRQYYLQTQALGAVINIIPNAIFHAGPAFNFHLSRDEDVENETVARLKEIDASYEIGGFVGVKLDGIWRDNDSIELQVKALTDVSDVHDGTTVELDASYDFMLGRRWRFGWGVSATYADDDYLQTYFGIDTADAGRSGLPEFNADSGSKDVGFDMSVGYHFNPRWGVLGLFSYKRLLDDAADSPIVTVEGDADQYFGGLGISYRF